MLHIVIYLLSAVRNIFYGYKIYIKADIGLRNAVFRNYIRVKKYEKMME